MKKENETSSNNAAMPYDSVLPTVPYEYDSVLPTVPYEYDSVLPTVPYEYGIMSSKYRILAKNKLTAYAVMCLHFQSNSHMVAIYEPESCKEDSWLNPTGQITERLDEIFGGIDSFDKYLEDNVADIKECYATIEKVC